MPYDEETRMLIENRKRKAEYRREQQMKKRKMTLAGLGVIIILLVIVIIVAASCSARRDEEVTTKDEVETSIIGMATTEENTDVVTNSDSTTNSESTSENVNASTETNPLESTSESTGNTIKYTNDTVNIRKKPNENSTILEVLEKNEKVVVVGVEGEWTKVEWGDIKGYISSEFLKD